LLDDVAADFPDLTIIMAHPAVPWQEEQLSVVLHKGNVYMDLSGWSPKYFRPILVQYIRSILKDKVLFGSDYPVLQPERWLQDFETLEFKDEVRQKILIENARKVLKL
ncbi:MAG: amidohydrolase family protein, partial [Anaerolineae bacterium]|nr:amidohydrolase family protein [Anaerolineae bacterium]